MGGAVMGGEAPIVDLLRHGLPRDPDLTQTLIAAGLAVILYALAAGIARVVAPRLADRLGPFSGPVGQGLSARTRAILRHGLAAGALAMLIALWPWTGLARLVVGLSLAVALAWLANHVLRGLAIPRWATWPLALLIFVMVISGSGGGLTPAANALEGIGFDLGKRRITLLGIFTLGATCVALFAAVRLINGLLGRSIGQAQGFDPTQKLLAQKLSAIIVVVAAFFIGIDLIGIDLTAFTVFSGAFGLAVGFGFQKTFGNLIAGIILLMDRSIKPGDVIVVGDSFGWVNKIGVRAVSVITRDGKEHLIPNENLMTMEVENWSYSDRNVRVRIPIGISFDSDTDLAQALMLQAALECPRVLREPQPNVWLTKFGESRIEYDILLWISDPENGVGNVKSDVLNRVWRLFRANGILIPFPQREIRIMGEKGQENPSP